MNTPVSSPNNGATLTLADRRSISALLEGGESMGAIISMMRLSASNALIAHISSHNQMIGRHREDFCARCDALLAKRREK